MSNSYSPTRLFALDLGSLNTRMAVLDGASWQILSPPGENSWMIPTSIFIDHEGNTAIGSDADAQQWRATHRYRAGFVSDLGQITPDSELKRLPTELLSTYIFTLLTLTGYRDTPKDAVVSLPVQMRPSARQALRDVIEAAGFASFHTIEEPLAAFRMVIEPLPDGAVLLIVQIGHTGFSVTLAHHNDTQTETINSVYVAGNSGAAFDRIIAQDLIQTSSGALREVLARDDDTGLFAHKTIESIARQIKHQLSQNDHVYVPISTAGLPQVEFYTLTRDRFVEMILPNIRHIRETIYRVLEGAKLEANDLNGVLLIGGSAHIPAIETDIRDEFNLTLLTTSHSCDLVALRGAAEYGLTQHQSTEASHENEIWRPTYRVQDAFGSFNNEESQ